jgi:large subunit ribosomal protein L25
MEAGQTIHLSEIKLPKGVEFVKLAHGDDAAVASVTKPRGATSAEEAEATPAAE